MHPAALGRRRPRRSLAGVDRRAWWTSRFGALDTPAVDEVALPASGLAAELLAGLAELVGT